MRLWWQIRPDSPLAVRLCPNITFAQTVAFDILVGRVGSIEEKEKYAKTEKGYRWTNGQDER